MRVFSFNFFIFFIMSQYMNLNNPSNYQLASFGQRGFEFLTGSASAPAGYYNAIQVLADCVLTVTSEKGDNLSAVNVPAGLTIVGLFSAVSITSGDVLVYKA